MKVIMIASKTSIFLRFRLDLVKQIIKNGHEVVVISPEEDSSFCLKHLGVKLIPLYLDKASLSFFNNFKYFLNLIKILKKEKPDKVFSYNIKPVIFGSIASKFAKVPEIYPMITGLGYIYSKNNLYFRILQFITGLGYKLSFRFSKKVIFQNKDDMVEFSKIRKYVDISKCTVVNGSGVNMFEFPRCELPKELSFLMVSRTLSLKGIQEYFEAAKLVKDKYPNIKFVFVGSTDNSPLNIDMKLFYDDYIKTEIIDFHKNCDNVREFLNNCSIFVLPSYYREGIPRALLESLAVGRPIITTNSVGCKEAFNNKNGFLVKPKDSNDLAEKMFYFIENPNLISKMANESYKYCKSKFDVNLVNNEIIKILQL